ncbi:D-alanine--D-alanine ligase [Candidatus Saccharibacteria bacterium]|nr:D-alanine--D-alanine ligase [Candidatus Saccharibacteria bacterium]
MKTVAVIFGGRSTEHDVSVVTALASVIKPLELTKQYQVEAVYISKDGSWFWDDRLKDIKLYQSGEIDDFMRKAPKVHILFDNGLTLVKSSQFAGRKMYKKIDVVFPAMHGTHGEDGELMGLLEMANVPYVGCPMPAAAIAMDKVLAKQVVEAGGVIKSTPWVWFYSYDLSRSTKNILDKIKTLEYPLFVKPAHLGSSIGISRVEKESELMNALEVAAHYDDKVIVEQAVDNLIEVTLPIMGNDEFKLAHLEEPLTKPEDFFDFETKYMQGGKKGKGAGTKGSQGYSRIPADLPKELYKKAEDVGLSAYMAIGCKGIARVDMLIDSIAKEVYFNEVNPLPGGLYAHNWAKAGISNVDLVQKLVDLAEERWQARQKLTTSFNTNYLKQF